jgi:hypothetical protein
MKYLKIIAVALLIWSCSDDNNISGKVINTKQQPIDSVKVMVTGTDIFTYSNENGEFEIDTNDLNDELMFEKKDFELKFQKIKHDSKLKIELVKK